MEKISESSLEKKLGEFVKKELGGLYLKYHSAYHTGMPDRIIVLDYGVVVFVELKAKRGMPSKLQMAAGKALLKRKQNYFLISGEEGLAQFKNELQQFYKKAEEEYMDGIFAAQLSKALN